MRCAEEDRYQELVRERDEAFDAYMAEIVSAPPVHDRAPDSQKVIDRLLGIYQKAAMKVHHYGIL